MATDPETIEELRHQIATSLASLAVPDLPHEAEGLGLSAGRAEEAQLGRYP